MKPNPPTEVRISQAALLSATGPPVALPFSYRLGGFVLTILQRIEDMGRKGAPPAIALSCLLAIVCAMATYLAWAANEADSTWWQLAPSFVALSAGAASVVSAMVGIRLLTRVDYGAPEDLFPSLHREDFLRALREETRPLCVCTRCLIHLPAQFSTGSCPRCNSSVEYYEIETDEDAKMAASAVP